MVIAFAALLLAWEPVGAPAYIPCLRSDPAIAAAA